MKIIGIRDDFVLIDLEKGNLGQVVNISTNTAWPATSLGGAIAMAHGEWAVYEGDLSAKEVLGRANNL